MKQTIKLNENEFRKLVSKAVKVINENIRNRNRKLVSESMNNITYVNDEETSDKLYIVSIWSGSGYHSSQFGAYAFSDEDALEKVIAYLDINGDDYLFQDSTVEEYISELESEGYSDEEIDEEIGETFIYVDATMEGASSPHYIYSENLMIDEQ